MIDRTDLIDAQFKQVEPDYDMTREGRYFCAIAHDLFNYRMYVFHKGNIYRAETGRLTKEGYTLDGFLAAIYKEKK
jgi:hypothetical protein